MKRLQKTTILISVSFLLCMLAVNLAFAQDFENSSTTREEAEAALIDLQDAIREGDVEAFAKHVSYPLRVNLTTKKHLRITTENEFIKKSKMILTQSVKDGILSAELSDAITRSEGVGFGNGVIWLRPDDGGLKIFAINP
jgi:hypothetical protein